MQECDVVVVGAGLAGLVATAELVDAGKKVVLVDQEGEQSLGGQAFWSFGGLFMIDSPEQRRMGIKDSLELATQDWAGSAAFDRDEDHWPRQWAQAYLNFAHGEKRAWLHEMGHRLFPVVGWAERGDGRAEGHGNTVPRFHITWGTGPGLVEPFERRVREGVERGLVTLAFRHRVDALTTSDGTVTGVHGRVLAPDSYERGRASNRDEVADFDITAQAVIVTSGGIGANHDLVRAAWPARLGNAPARMVSGVPAHVDGRMIGITQAAGGRVINPDRMWHYTEGVRNWDPIWANHGIRILPGPSSLWLDATGQRFPAPFYPGFDSLGTLGHIMRSGYGYSWFILTEKVLGKEFMLSGSEQNPDLTGRSVRDVLQRTRVTVTAPVQAFVDHGEDFVVAGNLDELVGKMNALAAADGSDAVLDPAAIRHLVEARDSQIDNDFSKDAQVTAIRGARKFRGDRLIRTAVPHKFLDPKNGPLVAVRLNILTRKTLGGLETDLSGRVLGAGGVPVPGLYAAGEVAGFGGGGMHGYNSLEGTFLGGCLFSGRAAGRGARDVC